MKSFRLGHPVFDLVGMLKLSMDVPQSRQVLFRHIVSQSPRGGLQFHFQSHLAAMTRHDMQKTRPRLLRRSIRPCKPVVSIGWNAFQTTRCFRQTPVSQVGLQRLPVKGRIQGGYIYDFITQSVKAGVLDLDLGQFLAMEVEQFGVVKDDKQHQPLAHPVAACGVCRQNGPFQFSRDRRHKGRISAPSPGHAPACPAPARALRPEAPAPAPEGSLCRAARAKELLQPPAQILLVIAPHPGVGNQADNRLDPGFKRRSPLRRVPLT